MKKAYITTLGCKLNFAESAFISRKLKELGYEISDNEQDNDVIIVNTCTVTAQAERKSKFAVKRALKLSPKARIIVIGCASQISAQKFLKLSDRVTVVGTEKKFEIEEILKSNKTHYSCNVFEVKKFENSYSIDERTRAFLKIQDGCDYPCSYCTIPLARGQSRNAPIAEIVEKAKEIVQHNVKEIVLTGVNIGDFGKTTNEKFIDLLKEIEKIDGLERIRISSIEPNLISDEIIDLASYSTKIMPHFHVPLQSGSDKILRLMKRRYSTKIFTDKILKISQKIKDVFLGIDVIVGFPSETDEDFWQTYKLLESLPIAYIHIFPYSDRPNTIASQIQQKVPSEVIAQRVKKLQELSDIKHHNFYQKHINEVRKVLIESRTKNGKLIGYTDNYINVAIEGNETLINRIIDVKLLKIDGEFVMGQILS